MNRIDPKRTAPPFPYDSYAFPIDKMRHWIEMQGDREFTAREASGATELDGNRLLPRLAAKGEVVDVAGTNFYRRAPGLWLVDFERIEESARKMTDGLNNILEVGVGLPIRRIAERLREEARRQPKTNLEVLLCADELEHILDRAFGGGR
jgi:hypothetical protein